ncbi:recombinase family protein [Modestobacter excelsi]|uniref:recombinase family protein n=1 Tax=Modestobacter excelsi TaxID=2213161 RepID=UPI001C20DC66|nr:recombinase family protein [Modestobacter excelsi]
MTATLTLETPLSAAPLRAVIYTRVSSDPNERGRSVSEQEVDCRAVCARNDWEVVKVFTDNDRSASRYATKVRAEHVRLIDFIESGAVDVLVTWESSRAQRDLDAYTRLRALCEGRGILWSYSGRVYDMRESADRFQTGLDALLAERESDETRKRVLRAVQANAEKGRPHGKLLYGYRRVYDEASGELVEQVPDETTSAVVREAAQRVLNGETPYAIAQDFDRRGIPTPRGGKGWDLTQVKRLCVNPGYAGKRVHRGKVVGDAGWPPLLDEGTHLALVAKLNDPARRSQRDSAVKHLLSGIAVCGVCGGRVRVQKNRGSLAYLCVDGFHVSRNEQDVDKFVTKVIVEWLKRPDVADLHVDTENSEQAAALAEAEEKRARLDGFYDAAAAGDLSPQALSRIEARLLPEIEAAERRARPTWSSPLIAEMAGPGAEDRWEGLLLPQRREIISTLMTVRINPAVRGARKFDEESIAVDWR